MRTTVRAHGEISRVRMTIYIRTYPYFAGMYLAG